MFYSFGCCIIQTKLVNQSNFASFFCKIIGSLHFYVFASLVLSFKQTQLSLKRHFFVETFPQNLFHWKKIVFADAFNIEQKKVRYKTLIQIFNHINEYKKNQNEKTTIASHQVPISIKWSSSFFLVLFLIASKV